MIIWAIQCIIVSFFHDLTTFEIWGRHLSTFLLVFWEIQKNQKDILILTDL